MGLRQLLRREEGRRRRQREKGRQEYRGERATRDIRLSLTRGTERKKQRTQRGRRRGNCLEGSVERDAAKYRGERAARDVRLKRRGRQLLGRQGGHAVEEDAAKYSKEHAKRDVRLSLTRGTERKKQRTQRGQRRGNCLKGRQRACKTRGQNQRETGRERRAQSTRVGLGAGVGAGKGEEVCGTPEGVRGAGNINWRERGGGRRLTLDSQRIKRKRADPDALSAAVLAGFARCLGGRGGEMSRDRASPRQHHPGDRLTRDHVGLPGAWVDTRRFHSDRCRDDRDGRRKRKGGVHKWGESAAQRGAVVQSEMLGGTRWKRVGWGRVRVAGENPSGSSAEWSAQVGATQSGVLGESVGNGRMRKPIRGVMVMVMVMVRVWVGWRKGRGKCSVECWGEQCWKRVGWGRGEVVGDDPPEVTQCGVSEVLGGQVEGGTRVGKGLAGLAGGRALSGAFPPSGEAGEEGREGGRREGHFHSNVTRETEELGEELEEKELFSGRLLPRELFPQRQFPGELFLERLFPKTTVAEGTIPRGTVSRGTVSAATVSRGTVSRATVPRGTVSAATVSRGTPRARLV
ncbi:hypothetical protein PMAC_001353, partial [Pneumocystis sp. 'macacae']